MRSETSTPFSKVIKGGDDPKTIHGVARPSELKSQSLTPIEIGLGGLVLRLMSLSLAQLPPDDKFELFNVLCCG